MTRTNCDLFTHRSSRSYLNYLVHCSYSYVYEVKTHILNLSAIKVFIQSRKLLIMKKIT